MTSGNTAASKKIAKTQLIEKFRANGNDTGSPEVQIALITSRLEKLDPHFGKHVKDHSSKRGLLGLVSRRKRLLSYLKREDVNRYRQVISSLGLRK